MFLSLSPLCSLPLLSPLTTTTSTTTAANPTPHHHPNNNNKPIPSNLAQSSSSTNNTNSTPTPPQQRSPHFYNTLIRAHLRSHHPDRALFSFHHMLSESIASPDNFTFSLVLKACAQLPAFRGGRQIHCMALKTPGASADAYVVSSMIHMYSCCGRLEDARRLFDTMPHRNVVVWNAMIEGFAKAGDMESARRFFDEMPERSIVSWNSMIGGYVGSSLSYEALMLFLEFRIVVGLMPDEATMVVICSGLADLGLLELGRTAHGYVRRREFSLEGALGVALITMYSKCGSISAACKVFSAIQKKNVSHWSSMIGAFAAHGLAEDSLRVFSEMLQIGIEPNHITFVGVLNACSHGGLVREGLEYFEIMKSYGIKPRIQHYGCLVDLLGRAGLIAEAMKLVDSLLIEPGFVIWSTLLSACRDHGNVEVAEIVAQKLIELESNHGSSYVILSNMYAHMGRWEEFRRMRKELEERRLDLVPGFSRIELEGCVHEFVAGDRYHLKCREIYTMLDEMQQNLRCAGCQPEMFDLTRDEESSESDKDISTG